MTAPPESTEGHFGILLISNNLNTKSGGGRELLSALNHRILRDLFGDQLTAVELPRGKIARLKDFFWAFNGHIDGANSSAIAKVMELIRGKGIRKVFVDGSNLGLIVKSVKQSYPEVEVVTFFHNVESRFFLGALKVNRWSPRALAVLIANYLAERKSVRYSDKIICLSERDSSLLKTVYGRPSSHVAPMALQDSHVADCHFTEKKIPASERFALFVGGSFYANRVGIEWFVKNVSRRVKIRTIVVGRGFETIKEELERDGNVLVVGPVDNLSDWYRDAHFVIAPIFDGSGMKTKVAEALMFGKMIVGTAEAFSGYEEVESKVGWRCRTADDFVTAIAHAQQKVLLEFDPELRRIFEENYSYSAARTRLKYIISR